MDVQYVSRVFKMSCWDTFQPNVLSFIYTWKQQTTLSPYQNCVTLWKKEKRKKERRYWNVARPYTHMCLRSSTLSFRVIDRKTLFARCLFPAARDTSWCWREQALLWFRDGLSQPESSHLIFSLFLFFPPWIMNKIIIVCSMKFLPHYPSADDYLV